MPSSWKAPGSMRPWKLSSGRRHQVSSNAVTAADTPAPPSATVSLAASQRRRVMLWVQARR